MNNEYLMHYGVPGMRWGVRRKSEEYRAYKTAKKKLRKTAKITKEFARVNTLMPTRWNKKHVDYVNKVNEARADKDIAYAKYKALKSERSEKKSYRDSQFNAGAGFKFVQKRNGYYKEYLNNRIQQEKGKEYANDILKKSKNMRYAFLAASAVGAIASEAVYSYGMKNI